MSVGDSSGVRSFGGGGGGGAAASIEIGNPVDGGGANRILYEDASQDLAADAGLTFLHTAGTINALNLVSPDTTRAFAPFSYDQGAGDVGVAFINEAATYTLGIDETDDLLKLSLSGTLGTDNVFTADGTTLTVVDQLAVTPLAVDGGIVFTDNAGKLEQSAGLTFGAGALNVIDDVATLMVSETGGNAAFWQADIQSGYPQVNFWTAGPSATQSTIKAQESGGNGVLTIEADELVLRSFASSVTIPSLAGTGSRTVVADANGKLSAP